MAKRRKSGLIDVLSAAPWWLILFISLAVFLASNFLLPMLSTSNVFLTTLSKVAPALGSILSLVVLFSLPFSIHNQLKRRRLLDTLHGINALRSLPWHEFELLVGEIFRRRGYSVKETGGGGPDGGIDLILSKPGQKIIVQCKHWKATNIGVTYIRELYGIMAAERASGCIFVSSGQYTKDAIAFAKGKAIELINGEQLYKLIDASRNNSPEAPACPICGASMMVRHAKKGSSKGIRFWGCSHFPKCRGTIAG